MEVLQLRSGYGRLKPIVLEIALIIMEGLARNPHKPKSYLLLELSYCQQSNPPQSSGTMGGCISASKVNMLLQRLFLISSSCRGFNTSR